MEVKEIKGQVESIQQRTSKAGKPYYAIGLKGLFFNYRQEEGKDNKAYGLAAGEGVLLRYKESEYEGEFGKQVSRWVTDIGRLTSLDEVFEKVEKESDVTEDVINRIKYCRNPKCAYPIRLYY